MNSKHLLKDHPDWAHFWDDEINTVENEVSWRIHENEIMPLILKYMSQNGLILDAGCGRGGMLVYLFRMGYRIKGCEISRKNIELIRRYEPKVIVDYEDILGFSYKENTFDAMLSYGVIEHFPEGPLQALLEANRVLKSGGILFISVPYKNGFTNFLNSLKCNAFLRKISKKKPKTNGFKAHNTNHYERNFKSPEFEKYLLDTNFEVIKKIPLFKKHTLVNMSSIFKGKDYPQKANYYRILNPPLSALGIIFYCLFKWINPWVLGHFQFFVAKKK